ncbi:MAG: type II toxin-antitoxin system HicA family toxin [Actinobacteria bacterium]|nr:type II toxin-antitoxin system HicA family toxin [Actinomycetota bacterium]MBU4301961.1 type II toxin-antitoxin system HicA family toxin [Actinomycetota bacterium]MBU4489218.1 type II toxin-antitoxin system HicA family toxin [Actinomycetota bacterium]MCG2795741.1 type II toxin-antitoxin system HicA family toxin [Actinomycetes bacterium]
MTRLPRVSGKDVVSALTRAGFALVHIRGSHHYLRKEGTGKIVVVPVHGKSTVPLGTLKSILRQANLTVEEFVEFLSS